MVKKSGKARLVITCKSLTGTLFGHTQHSQLHYTLKDGRIDYLQTDTAVTWLKTICPFLTSLTVGQPWLLQPYASCLLLSTPEFLFRNLKQALWAGDPFFSHKPLFRSIVPLYLLQHLEHRLFVLVQQPKYCRFCLISYYVRYAYYPIGHTT